MGRNDPSDIVSEGHTKKNGRFELTEMFTECSWDLDQMLAEYANKYMDTFVFNQTLIKLCLLILHQRIYRKGKT